MKRIADMLRKLLKDPSKNFTSGGYTGDVARTHELLRARWDKQLRPGEYFIEANSPAQEGKPGSVA